MKWRVLPDNIYKNSWNSQKYFLIISVIFILSNFLSEIIAVLVCCVHTYVCVHGDTFKDNEENPLRKKSSFLLSPSEIYEVFVDYLIYNMR
jgi:hypothetical protein